MLENAKAGKDIKKTLVEEELGGLTEVKCSIGSHLRNYRVQVSAGAAALLCYL